MPEDVMATSPFASSVCGKSPSTQLAALRIVVPLMMLVTPELRHVRELASVPPALWVAPEGLGWFVHFVPIGPNIATAAQALCAFAAFSAIVGVCARPALLVLTLAGAYVFSISQLAGSVWHDMHLLWMSALLVVSPCDEAWAFDHRGQPEPTPSRRYGVPLTFARLLLACIYFFPGIHKLRTSGLAWALSDNLRNQLWWKWAENGMLPALRVDRVPTLLHAGGLFVLAFELAFPLLALLPRGRPFAAVLGLLFHLMATVYFRIPFVSLWALYVVLVDPTPVVRALLRPFGRRAEHAPAVGVDETGLSPRLALVAVGVVLVAGAFVQGVRGQMQSYPFACYPTFEWMLGTEMPDLVIVVETRDGERLTVPHARDARGKRTQRQWAEIWSLAGVTRPVDPARLKAYLSLVARRSPAQPIVARGVLVQMIRASVSVVPEERENPPKLGHTLLEVPLARAPLAAGFAP